MSHISHPSLLGTLLSETLSEPSTVQSALQPSTIPRLESTQSVDYPLSEPLLGGCAPRMHPPMTSSPLLQKQSLSQHSQSTPSVALLAGNPAFPPPRKKTRMELRSEDSGHLTALKDPAVVVKKYADLANVADMGKLACMLARPSFFGADVLKVSTFYGKFAQFQALNCQKLSALFAIIHELPVWQCGKSDQTLSLGGHETNYTHAHMLRAWIKHRVNVL